MPFFTFPTSFRNANTLSRGLDSQFAAGNFSSPGFSALVMQGSMSTLKNKHAPPHSSHPPFSHLLLLVFEAVMEVVCVSAPGYIVARQGMFDAEMQKFAANLNVMLFTPCLIFTKLASQLTAEKLVELAVIPVIFIVQTVVSLLCSILVAKVFRFKKRPRNFVVAMGVFGNSNSLPISLVISLSQTIKGLHWDKVPGDNDDEVSARGILYLLIFQQLGQLLRWSWGYHVLLAPPDHFEYETEHTNSQMERGSQCYLDSPPGEDQQRLLEDHSTSGDQENDPIHTTPNGANSENDHQNTNGFKSHSNGCVTDDGERTPITHQQHTSSVSSHNSSTHDLIPNVNGKPVIPEFSPNMATYTRLGTEPSHVHEPTGSSTLATRFVRATKTRAQAMQHSLSTFFRTVFKKLPSPLQGGLQKAWAGLCRFLLGVWAFMNPPLWAMLAAILVASIPSLQKLFFTEGTFIQNSVTSAIRQSGGVAVPLILVVLGANLAGNTLPKDARFNRDDSKEEQKLLIAALISRMLLPIVIMAPLLALTAKYVPVSILDDPIFVIVCFLLTGAPSALQLAQICQINDVYVGAMSKLLFHSYVIWILPSTLILVLLAIESLEWAAA